MAGPGQTGARSTVRMMDCVLRISGRNLDTRAIGTALGTRPYRIDIAGVGRATTNCLHYAVPAPSRPSARSMRILECLGWLRDGLNISRIAARKDVDSIDLDCGIVMDTEQVTATAGIGLEAMSLAGRLGVSITISVYRGDG